MWKIGLVRILLNISHIVCAVKRVTPIKLCSTHSIEKLSISQLKLIVSIEFNSIFTLDIKLTVDLRVIIGA